MTEWRDEQTLNELYHGEGLTLVEVGERLGCTDNTILRWMKRHGIPRRDEVEQLDKWRRCQPAHYRTAFNGYEEWKSKHNGKQDTALVHRLVVVAESGLPNTSDWVVHHKNGIQWDNRPCNLEVLTDSDHKKHHAKQRWQDDEYRKAQEQQAAEREHDAEGRFI